MGQPADFDTREWTALWRGVHVATLDPDRDAPYGWVRDGAVAVRGERIAWVGRAAELPPDVPSSVTVHEGAGRWLTPGLIDCHTHVVHAGSRAEEFEARLTGVSYAEISRRGGGIVSTVRATREASEQALFDVSLARVDRMLAEGVTTLEIKSGYGLERESELKQLRVARRIGEARAVGVRTSFLGAHALPPEFDGHSDGYIEQVCEEMIPAAAAAGLADAVDAFCEGIAFNVDQIARVFEASARHGLPVKLHAEQLSDLGGAALAARHGALSADHLEYVSERALAAMAQAGTVAVLLPGAFYFLRETRRPPVALLREHRVPIAIATDYNPGSSPLGSILLAMNMACTLFEMTPEEALAGATRHAARALGLAAEVGMIRPGMAADFALWCVDHPAELAYRMGFNPCSGVVRLGRVRG